MDKVKCKVCGKEFHAITATHLKKHGLTVKRYRELYPGEPLCSDEFVRRSLNVKNTTCKYCGKRFPNLHALAGHISLTHKYDGRFDGRTPWNKGLTKEDPRVRQYVEKATATIREKIKRGEYNPTKNLGIYAIKGKAPPPWNKGLHIRLNPKGEFKKGHKPWNKGLPKEMQPMYGRKHSEEARKKMERTWFKKGHKHPPEVIEKIRKKRLQQPPPKGETTPERLLKSSLRKNGISFEEYFPIFGQPDIAIPNKKIAIFVDGCYWHGCPRCNSELNGHQLRNKYKDRYVTRKLEEQGWKVLRFWEHEIYENLEGVVEMIKEEILK